MRLVRALAVALLALAAAGCGGSSGSGTWTFGVIRPPDAKTDMDDNAANLASADVTFNFGQLPAFIDEGNHRLLPYDVDRAASPGQTVRHVYRLTVPRTQLVLDTVVTSALTEAQARDDARQFTVGVSYDGRPLPDANRYWVFYRNNGAQICRIYFPGDLGALNMGVNSLVFAPLSAGEHVVRVLVRQRMDGGPAAWFVSEYRLHVLDRGPNSHERAISPDEKTGDAENVNRTPLVFRAPQK